MIRLGLNVEEKKQVIRNYCDSFGIRKVYFFTPRHFDFDYGCDGESVMYDEIILYKVFYKLLKEIDSKSLIVINECLRTQNRSDLTYNCLRQYLNQTNHQIIFQYLPQIDEVDDFMILLDFDTKTRYKIQPFRKEMINSIDLVVKQINVSFNSVPVQTNIQTKAEYEKKKQNLFDNIGLRDPHTIPRNLYLIGGKDKVKTIDSNKVYIGRNNRFKLENLKTYSDQLFEKRIIFELPHNFINFSDYLYLSQSGVSEVLTTELKVDKWYFSRYEEWAKRIKNGYTNLQ